MTEMLQRKVLGTFISMNFILFLKLSACHEEKGKLFRTNISIKKKN